MLSVDGRGLSPNLKSSCQTFLDRDEDATSLLPLAGGSEPPLGSRIVILPRGDFHRYIIGDFCRMIKLMFLFGMVGSRGRGSTVPALSWAKDCALSKNRSMVIFLLVTIASS